jgi:hypothetical protein
MLPAAATAAAGCPRTEHAYLGGRSCELYLLSHSSLVLTAIVATLLASKDSPKSQGQMRATATKAHMVRSLQRQRTAAPCKANVGEASYNCKVMDELSPEK